MPKWRCTCRHGRRAAGRGGGGGWKVWKGGAWPTLHNAFSKEEKEKKNQTNTQKNKNTKNCTERIMSRYLDKYANLPAWCPFHLLYLRPPSSLGSRRSIAFSLALPLLHPSLIFFSLFFVPLSFLPTFYASSAYPEITAMRYQAWSRTRFGGYLAICVWFGICSEGKGGGVKGVFEARYI